MDEYLTYSRIPSRLGKIKRRDLRRRAVEEEGHNQQRCLMEVACNGYEDEESVSLCVTISISDSDTLSNIYLYVQSISVFGAQTK